MLLPMKVLFIIPDRVHLLDICGPVHLFYEAREYGAELELAYATPILEEPAPVSSCMLPFARLPLFSTVPLSAGDLIIIPGFEMEKIQSKEFKEATAGFREWLNIQLSRKVHIASICTGVFVLGQAGLLDNRACTTHWKFTKLLTEQYPKTEVLDKRLFVSEGLISTSAGVASGIDLSLYLLEQRFGPQLATDVAREVVLFSRRGAHDPQLSVFMQYRNHLEDRVHEAQNWIAQHLGQPFRLEDIAGHLYITPRHLTRIFKAATGLTIQKYTNQLRAERAAQLIKQGEKMITVANACGLSSTNQLRKILKDANPSSIPKTK